MRQRLQGNGSFDVRFPISYLQGGVTYEDLEVRQDIREHDMAIVTIKAQTLQTFDTLASGTPIQITYGSSFIDATETFIGYVTHVVPLQEDGREQYRRQVVAVSASRDFRRTGNDVWRNKTIPEIVQDIGRRFGYRVVTRQHGLRRKQTVQSGMTYWEFMAKLAKRIGYVLRVEGATLVFMPLDQYARGLLSRAPYLTSSTSVNRLGMYPTLYSLTAWTGDTSDDDDDTSDAAVVVAVEPLTGRSHSVRAVPRSAVGRRPSVSAKYSKYRNAVVAHTRADARLLAAGIADNGMMAFDARGECLGDAVLAPYRPVYVGNSESELSGWWIVKSATHRLSRKGGTYATDVVLSTDSLAPSSFGKPPTGRYRDVDHELAAGWSPDLIARARLKSTSASFVAGLTRDAQSAARWVAV